MYDELQRENQELQAKNNNMEAAGILMQNMMNSGVVEQTGRDSIVVHSASGDKEFKLEDKE